MKIKHYHAADMRTALRQVREAQGPDAVILSSRRVQGGVEVVAAIDYDVEVADGPGESAAGYGLAQGADSSRGDQAATFAQTLRVRRPNTHRLDMKRLPRRESRAPSRATMMTASVPSVSMSAPT